MKKVERYKTPGGRIYLRQWGVTLSGGKWVIISGPWAEHGSKLMTLPEARAEVKRRNASKP
jgi:hypothetical protein